ncbi:hypothetical protein HDU79_003577 [Rhizoclosmatium sp. JEL0117]|nr:hypothetical protein HDU79_003577 [Rhizoclosmatium sp. JEL0117]
MNPLQALVGLASIPPELLQSIIAYLPLDKHLLSLGLASKQLLAPFIFHSLPFARQHVRFQLSQSECATSLWDFLEASNIKHTGWLSLPLNYQTAVYGEIMLTSDWEAVSEVGRNREMNLMWSLRWDLPPQRALKVITALLEDPLHFDASNQDNRPIRWASRNGHLEVVELLLTIPSVDPSAVHNSAIGVAAQFGHLEIVELLLRDPRVDPADDENYAARFSAEIGHPRVLARLLQDSRVDASAKDNIGLQLAAQNGHLEVVKLLLRVPEVDPSVDDNFPIRMACQKGYLEIVRVLLEDNRVDPTARENHAIGLASEHGFLEIVRLLLSDSRVNPSDDDNYSIFWAVKNGHSEVVKELWADPRLTKSDALRQILIEEAKREGHAGLWCDFI